MIKDIEEVLYLLNEFKEYRYVVTDVRYRYVNKYCEKEFRKYSFRNVYSLKKRFCNKGYLCKWFELSFEDNTIYLQIYHESEYLDNELY